MEAGDRSASAVEQPTLLGHLEGDSVGWVGEEKGKEEHQGLLRD